jgi:hypothetical protein
LENEKEEEGNNVDINRALESIRENIEASATDNLLL